MFNSKNSFAFLVVTLTLGASTVAPSISASTNSLTKPSSEIKNSLQDISNNPLNNGSNNSSLSSSQQEQLEQEITSRTITTTDDDGNTVTSISDSEMLSAVEQVDPELTNELRFGVQESEGTSKIVWHGKARNGNFDIYLSAGMLNLAKKAGINVALTALLAPLAAIPGAGAAAAVFAVKQLLSGWVVHEDHFSYGRILHFKGFEYKNWDRQ